MMFVGSRSAFSEPRFPPPCATVVFPAHPTMTIRSTGITADGDTHLVEGELNLHGVTKSVPPGEEWFGYPARERRRAEAEQRKVEAKAKREHEKRVHDLEMKVLTLEGRQKELTVELEKPETYEAGGSAMHLNRELQGVTEELERLTAEWNAVAGLPSSV